MIKKVILAFFIMTYINAGQLDFTEHGFSVESFSIDAKQSGNYVVVMFAKPSNNNIFSTNINIIAQDFNGSIKEYVQASDKEFNNTLGFRTIHKSSNNEQATWEYTILTNGMHMHFLSKVLFNKKNNKFYLITGSALESNWKNDEKNIRKVVDSFKLH